jgi:hypothetical protein
VSTPQPSSANSPHTPDAWQEFTSAEGAFSILLPGTPITEERTAPNGKTTRLVEVELKDGAYLVSYIDVGAGRPRDPSTVAKDLAAKHAGTVLAESDFTVAGASGKEFELHVSRPQKGYLSARVVAVNGRLYQFLVLGTHAHVKDPDVQKFFESFRLTK